MNRRHLLRAVGAGSAACCLAQAAGLAQAPRPAKTLYFTKSSGFEHSVVKRAGAALSHSEKILVELGAQHDLAVTCSKDGGLFTPDRLAEFELLVFYTTGDLTTPGTDGQPPMSKAGKQLFLEQIAAGKPFVGIHTATDTFHSPGGRQQHNTADLDPYIQMVGGEFISHGKQQQARMVLSSPAFPGCEGLGDGFDLHDEWYTFKNNAADLHTILVQQTAGMEGAPYERPAFPATWARMHGQGRVFYTSMGHREDVWTNPTFQAILLGGIDWALRRRDAAIEPNLASVAPGYAKLPGAPG